MSLPSIMQWLGADGAGGDLAGPLHDAGHPHAALECGPFALAQRAGGPTVIAVAQPRSVIRYEDDKRVLVEAVPFEGVENSAHRPIDLTDYIAVESSCCLAPKIIRNMQGHMGHWMRQIQEESVVLVGIDKCYSSLGERDCKLLLILVRDL